MKKRSNITLLILGLLLLSIPVIGFISLKSGVKQTIQKDSGNMVNKSASDSTGTHVSFTISTDEDSKVSGKNEK
jgi:hypothetical protein